MKTHSKLSIMHICDTSRIIRELQEMEPDTRTPLSETESPIRENINKKKNIFFLFGK